MDKLKMNNTKHHEKVNTHTYIHTQVTKNNTIQRSSLLYFPKRQFVGPCKLSWA